jgi:site-specific recombinase XerD
MGYSIKPILHKYADTNGNHKVLICVTFNRARIYLSTPYKATEFKNGEIINHANAKQINVLLKAKVNDVEAKIISALKDKDSLSKVELRDLLKNNRSSGSVVEFMNDIVENNPYNLAPGRLKVYKVVIKKLKDCLPDLKFKDVSITTLQKFEIYIRKTGVDQNTVNAQMKLLKSVMNKARVKKLINREQYEDYSAPKFEQKIPEYLTEDEITRLHDFVKVCGKESYKTAGYYFLLSCYTGFRLSDAKGFDYAKRVQDGNITLRAKKNGSIVSIPVHNRLVEVLEYVKNHPLTVSEQYLRDQIKELCKWVGIKKHIKFHSARHSWAMLLMCKGFSLEETAETLGNTIKVASIYARVTNLQLANKIKERL